MKKITTFFLFCFFIVFNANAVCRFNNSIGNIKSDNANKTKSATNTFKIFNQIRYNKTPDLSGYGFIPISVPPQLLMIDTVAPYATLFPEVVKYAKANVSADYICLDIEKWSYAASQISTTRKKLIAVLDTTRVYNTHSLLGYYNVPNKPAYQWSSIAPAGSSAYTNWQALNDSLSQLYRDVDFIAPSFYAYDNDTASWRLFVQANVSEIKRKLNGITRPVYGFIWPQYHNSTTSFNLQFIDTVRWKFQLETLYRLTDGVIIWTSNKDSAGNTLYFSTSMPWWIATLNFMKQHGLLPDSSPNLIQSPSVQSDISVFPNPASGSFSIKSEFRINYLELINMNGQTVFHREINAREASLFFNSPGLYLAVMNTENGTFTRKFIIQR